MLLSLLITISSMSFAQFTEMASPLPGPKSPPVQAPVASSTLAAPMDPQDEKLLTKPVAWMIDAVNQARQKAGLETLTFDASCARSARDHAYDTGKNRLRGHVGSDSSLPQDRYKRYSSDFSMISENWGFISDPSGQKLTPREMMIQWMKSPNHRANILDASAKRMGVGFYRVGTNLYAVQCFSAP